MTTRELQEQYVLEEGLIGIETAILAKEKGFDEPTLNHWERGTDDNGWGLFTSGRELRNSELTPIYTDINMVYGEFSAPTQSRLQKWLREVPKIYVEVSVAFNENEQVFYRVGAFKTWTDLIDITLSDIDEKRVYYNTYEEALESGLVEGLKLI